MQDEAMDADSMREGKKQKVDLSGRSSTQYSSEMGSVGLPKPVKSILSETRNANFLD